MEAKKPTSILKHNSTKRKVMWDETNLEENEKIKAEFADVHVDEPDTPFNRDFHIEDEIDENVVEGSVTPELLTAALNALANGDIENNIKKPRYCETVSEFEKRRKEHYDEYRKMKEFREAHMKELAVDDCDDDEKNEEKNDDNKKNDNKKNNDKK